MIKRVDCLDGLRGLASLWVLLGHCTILTGFAIPILGVPSLGVDLFMLLSGFLMVFQFSLRSDFEDWDRARTWRNFWVRRFFRLSPLYFLMLVFALVFGAKIYLDRVAIDHFLGNGAQLQSRYMDDSITNIILHLTYLFGMFPNYCFKTALPDWSLSLEMQFYLVFPFIVFASRRLGWTQVALVIAAAMIAVAVALHATGIEFPMPSFLPLKLHVFLAGMLLAVPVGEDRTAFWIRIAAGALLAALPMTYPIGVGTCAAREVMFLVLAALVHARSFSVVDRIAQILGTRPFFWLGELSYGVYLVHLLVAQPVAAWVIHHYAHGLSPAVRFAMVAPIVIALSYTSAIVTYRLVERPGQKFGKYLLRGARLTRGAQTRAKGITAP